MDYIHASIGEPGPALATRVTDLKIYTLCVTPSNPKSSFLLIFKTFLSLEISPSFSSSHHTASGPFRCLCSFFFFFGWCSTSYILNPPCSCRFLVPPSPGPGSGSIQEQQTSVVTINAHPPPSFFPSFPTHPRQRNCWEQGKL